MTIAVGDTAHATGPLPGRLRARVRHQRLRRPLPRGGPAGARPNGYGALALTLGHPHLDPFAEDADDRAAHLRARLDELGWRVVVETGTRYLLDPYAKHRPTLVDEFAAARIRFLRRAVDLAAILRADCVSLWSGVLPEGVDADEGWRRLVPRMREIVAYAAASGVALGFEPEPGMLVETVADALAPARGTRIARRGSASPSTWGTASSSSPTASWAPSAPRATCS